MADELRDTPRLQDAMARALRDDRLAGAVVDRVIHPASGHRERQIELYEREGRPIERLMEVGGDSAQPPSSRNVPHLPTRGEQIAIATAEVSHAVVREHVWRHVAEQDRPLGNTDQNRQDTGNKL